MVNKGLFNIKILFKTSWPKIHLFIIFTGSVKVWDPRQKDKPVAVMEPEEGEIKRDCWAVGFGWSFLFSVNSGK